MVRPLVISETHILRKAVSDAEWNRRSEWHVEEEYYLSPKIGKSRQWFNTPFTLVLRRTLPSPQKRKIVPLSILPRSVGGEIFVVLTSVGTPAMVELLGSQGLSVEDFKTEIDLIDSRVSQLLNNDKYVPMRRAKLLRVVAFDDDVVFLASSQTNFTEIMSRQATLHRDASAEFTFRLGANRSFLIEGVISRAPRGGIVK